MTEKIFSEDGHDVELSHLDKMYFPASGLTKGDLVAYYRRVAPVMLPHLRDRAVTMQRFPDGIGGEGFYQREIPAHAPAWIARARLPKQGGHVDHALVNDAATLVYLANQGCITLHTSLARVDRPEHPDRLVFDLDPSDDDFGKVRSAARRIRALLDELGLRCFLQTTGSRGLHVVVPLDRGEDFDAVRGFAREVGTLLASRHPNELTMEQRKDKRGNAVYIDILRNAFGQSAVAPYSVRALEGAPVATPIRWDELGKDTLQPRRYTIGNLFQRLGRMDDPWSAMAGGAQSLEAARRELAAKQ